VALLSVPGEPFTEISQQIVSGSPFRDTLFSGYSNGGFGYLPVRSACGDDGHEVQTSPFPADAADIVVEGGCRMLNKLAEGKVDP
jgi:hypothetical protein